MSIGVRLAKMQFMDNKVNGIDRFMPRNIFQPRIIQTRWRFPLQFNKCSLYGSLWFRLNFETPSPCSIHVPRCVFYQVVPCTCGFVLSASGIRYTRTPVFISLSRSLSFSLPVLPSLIRFLCVWTSAFVNREDRAGCN